MDILIVQIFFLFLAVLAVLLCFFYFPNPSPLVRRFLPPRSRWPEAQIRLWLVRNRFHKSFLSYFYRDPERLAPPGEGYLAPADGLITSDDVQNGIRYLVIALSFWDMHVQRSPISGTVISVVSDGDIYMDGEGRNFAFLRQKACPVQTRIVLLGKNGEIAVRLITSLAARRIETWIQQGSRVDRGERIGRILLGSTVVLELPESIELSVKVGERVRAGETVIGCTGKGDA